MTQSIRTVDFRELLEDKNPPRWSFCLSLVDYLKMCCFLLYILFVGIYVKIRHSFSPPKPNPPRKDIAPFIPLHLRNPYEEELTMSDKSSDQKPKKNMFFDDREQIRKAKKNMFSDDREQIRKAKRSMFSDDREQIRKANMNLAFGDKSDIFSTNGPSFLRRRKRKKSEISLQMGKKDASSLGFCNCEDIFKLSGILHNMWCNFSGRNPEE